MQLQQVSWDVWVKETVPLLHSVNMHSDAHADPLSRALPAAVSLSSLDVSSTLAAGRPAPSAVWLGPIFDTWKWYWTVGWYQGEVICCIHDTWGWYQTGSHFFQFPKGWFCFWWEKRFVTSLFFTWKGTDRLWIDSESGFRVLEFKAAVAHSFLAPLIGKCGRKCGMPSVQLMLSKQNKEEKRRRGGRTSIVSIPTLVLVSKWS